VPITFYIPEPLRPFSGGLPQVQIDSWCTNLSEVLEALWLKYPGIRDRMVNEEGQLRQHINIFVGTEDIRNTGDLSTPVPPSAEISILPAISGG
jgi:sulfur-carrier protein